MKAFFNGLLGSNGNPFIADTGQQDTRTIFPYTIPAQRQSGEGPGLPLWEP